MDGVNLQRMLLEAAVDGGIRQIEKDPRRGVRRLVDLGRQISKGRFQSQIFCLFQGLLENESSPYYDLISRLVARVDHRTLKRVGINVGFESWTNGARRIRETEERGGFCVPWTMLLHMAPGRAGALPVEAYAQIVERGTALGVNTYQLLLDEPAPDIGVLTRLFSRFPRSVFLCFLKDARLPPADIDVLSSAHNAVVSVPAQVDGAEALARRLRGAECLYAAHWRYGCAEDAACGEAMERVAELESPLVLFIAEPDCPQADRAQVAGFALEARTHQRYPMILMDLYEDIRYVDRIISSQECLVEVAEDGLLYGSDVNIGALPLEAALRARFPLVAGKENAAACSRA